MSGYWSFRDVDAPATTSVPADIHTSMSAQVLPYGREIALETQRPTLSTYPWARTDVDSACEVHIADPAIEPSSAATTNGPDSVQITPWKVLSGAASPQSAGTRERTDAYTEEDITLIEMDAEDDDGDDTKGVINSAMGPAAGVSRRLPFDVHCARDLALDETQSVWWRNATADHEMSDNEVGGHQLADLAQSAKNTHLGDTTGTALGVLQEAILPTEAAQLVDEEDRATLTQMLAPHRCAPPRRTVSARSSSSRPPQSRQAEPAPARTGDLAPTPETEATCTPTAASTATVVVGQAQRLAPRPQSSRQPHRDPHPQAGTAQPPRRRSTGPRTDITSGDLTFVERMEQRAAARQQAREALKRQQEAHACALLAQHVDQRDHVLEAHKSADGRPAFTLYGMRCSRTTEVQSARTKTTTPSSTRARAATTARTAKDAPVESPRRRSSSRTRRSAPSAPSSAAPCRVRIAPLADEESAEPPRKATSARSSSTTSQKFPRRVRFVDDSHPDRTVYTADPAERKEEQPPTATSASAVSHDPEADAVSKDPILFHELAALMSEERDLALHDHDLTAAAAIEQEMALLASDYHALRLTTSALQRWRGARTASRCRGLPAVDDARCALLLTSTPVRGAAIADPTHTHTSIQVATPWEPDTFPSSPLVAAYHGLEQAEARARDVIMYEEATVFAALARRQQRLALALHTLLARTQQRQLQALRWYFVAWISLEESHRTARMARTYREHLLACARDTLVGLGMNPSY